MDSRKDARAGLIGTALATAELHLGSRRSMSVFAVKLLTLLGYILYAGGPVDAVSLAMGPAEGDRVASLSRDVECVVGCGSETVARSVAGPMRMARLVLADEAKMPLLRSSTLDFEGEDIGSDGGDRQTASARPRTHPNAVVVNLGRTSARTMGIVE